MSLYWDILYNRDNNRIFYRELKTLTHKTATASFEVYKEEFVNKKDAVVLIDVYDNYSKERFVYVDKWSNPNMFGECHRIGTEKVFQKAYLCKKGDYIEVIEFNRRTREYIAEIYVSHCSCFMKLFLKENELKIIELETFEL